MPNTAENETWGECIGEFSICNADGVVGAGTDRAYGPCTGGHHTGPGQFIRCTSSYHQQNGPMSPGIAFMPAEDPEARDLPGLRHLMERPRPWDDGEDS